MDRIAAAAEQGRPRPVDPSVFGDPLALQTQWTALEGGGSSFGTHRLVEVKGGSLEFKSSAGLVVFGALFLMVVFGVGAIFTLAGESMSALIGAIFVGLGLWMLWPTPRRFDSAARQYISRKEPVPFSRIRALQLLPERVRPQKGPTFTSYELNLVLDDGERRNVVDHGNLETLRADSARLAQLLGCPVWDAARQ